MNRILILSLIDRFSYVVHVRLYPVAYVLCLLDMKMTWQKDL